MSFSATAYEPQRKRTYSPALRRRRWIRRSLLAVCFAAVCILLLSVFSWAPRQSDAGIEALLAQRLKDAAQRTAAQVSTSLSNAKGKDRHHAERPAAYVEDTQAPYLKDKQGHQEQTATAATYLAGGTTYRDGSRETGPPKADDRKKPGGAGARPPQRQTPPSHALHAHKQPAKPEDMRSALRRVFALAPDEMRTTELLKPLRLTGEARLKDLGFRTRVFRTLLEAWESLHFEYTPEGVRVRNDITQLFWSSESETTDFTDLIHNYEEFRGFLTQLANLLFPWIMPFHADHMALHSSFFNGGRGIVLTAGNGQAHYLLTVIPSLRWLGCDLPIEIMYLGEEDLNEDWRMKFEAFPHVVCRDLSKMVADTDWKLKGWASKPFSILMSTFREVIFIDADALFFVTPDVLFDDPSYIKTGALFFRDRLIMPESKKSWLLKVLPKPISKQVKQNRLWTGDSGHMQESGVLVIDKWKHFVSLLLVTRMNGPDRDGNKEKKIVGVYDMVYGKSDLLVGDGM